MKRLLYTLFFTSTVFANDNLEYPALESLPKMHLDDPISSDRYSYFTAGSSLLLQQVGVGRRYRNFETLKGYDFGFNINFSLFLFSISSVSPTPPSFKYTYLKYKNNNRTSPYFGVGYEVGLIIKKHPLDFFDFVHFVPNIGLIWGKERENIRFTQLQLNAIPAVALVVGTGFLLFSSDSLGCYVESIAALGSASNLFSYNVGF